MLRETYTVLYTIDIGVVWVGLISFHANSAMLCWVLCTVLHSTVLHRNNRLSYGAKGWVPGMPSPLSMPAPSQSNCWQEPSITIRCTVLHCMGTRLYWTVMSNVAAGLLFQHQSFVQQHGRSDSRFQVVDRVHNPLEQFKPNARHQRFGT